MIDRLRPRASTRRRTLSITVLDAKTAAPPDGPRVGAVSYLNSKPLIEGLAERLPAGLALDYPSRLAAALKAGDLDVALVPSIEVLQSGGRYEVVSDACVAARGPVLSVKVYFRTPPGEVKTLSLDEGSRTSAILARVLLSHKYGVEPDTEPLPLEAGKIAASKTIAATSADAILLIGDRAMFPLDEQFQTVWDLGDEWLTWTGLPFVFALWAARREDVPDGLATLLSSTRDYGVASADEIARREATTLGLEPEVAIEYLTKHLHFTLGPAERSGLKLFAQLAQQAGLAPGGNELVFRDDPADSGQCDIKTAAERAAPHAIAPRRLVGAR
ncbi:MAG: menaquinone biosynthesis protein [Planctomycetota bacterium]|nr:menaquinone biosynthesis protein [Planctomycetaceae bacterium]MDQ3329605.1 menaquinone biosynthesis protein [Planctomycetota bacterium]